MERRSFDVLDHVGQASGIEEIANRGDQVGIGADLAVVPVDGVGLTGRRSMDRIKPTLHPIAKTEESVSLDTGDLHYVCAVKLKREARLLLDVHADDVEACPVVSHGAPAGATEEIKETGPTPEFRNGHCSPPGRCGRSPTARGPAVCSPRASRK